MTTTPDEDARVLLAFGEYQSSASSHSLLLAVITWLELKEKDRDRWPGLETILFRALAARERAVWLEAAEMIEQYKTTDGSSSPGQATVRHLVTKCRQQAEAVR